MPDIEEIFNLASVASGHTTFPHHSDALRAQGLLKLIGPGQYALTELGDAYMHALAAVPVESVSLSGLVFDPDKRTLNGVYFTKLHWEFLTLLWKRRGRTVCRAGFYELMCEGRDREPMEKTIDVHMCKIRKALKGVPVRIDTLWGTGFIMVEITPNG